MGTQQVNEPTVAGQTVARLKEGNELAQARFQERRFQNMGGVVSDVMNLLENTARLHDPRLDEKLDERRREQMGRVRQMAMLVSRHALQGVLGELNDECRKYWSQNPDNFLP